MNNTPESPDIFVELAKTEIRAWVERREVIKVGGDGKIAAGMKSEAGRDGAGAEDGRGGGCVGAGSAGLDFSPLLAGRAGVFVSIKKDGALRGCIGTISPVKNYIADEIIENAISACSRDPRFDAVKPDELNSLTVSVDVLSEAEPVDSKSQLDEKRYGVIVSKGYRRGLLLPNLEGVESVGHQLAIALSKAGIGASENYSIERFEVVRHERGGSMKINT